MPGKQIETIDTYISKFPEEVQDILNKIRVAIKEEAPQAEEDISYGIPTFKLNGNLVHFAAFKNHFSFFPTPSAINAFSKDLSPYEISKGTIKFSFGKPVPFDLIKRIVAFRVKENIQR